MNICVLCSVHQPGAEMFGVCNNSMLLQNIAPRKSKLTEFTADMEAFGKNPSLLTNQAKASHRTATIRNMLADAPTLNPPDGDMEATFFDEEEYFNAANVTLHVTNTIRDIKTNEEREEDKAAPMSWFGLLWFSLRFYAHRTYR